MPSRETTLGKQLVEAQNIELNPNEGSRLQNQIDLLAAYLLKKVGKSGT